MFVLELFYTIYFISTLINYSMLLNYPIITAFLMYSNLFNLIVWCLVLLKTIFSAKLQQQLDFNRDTWVEKFYSDNAASHLEQTLYTILMVGSSISYISTESSCSVFWMKNLCVYLLIRILV